MNDLIAVIAAIVLLAVWITIPEWSAPWWTRKQGGEDD